MNTTTPEQDERLNKPSASSFNRLVNCPGHRQLAESLVTDDPTNVTEVTSPEAERGQRIHKARETGSPEGLHDDDEIAAWRNWIKLEMRLMNQWSADMGIHGASIVEGPRELRLWLNDPTTMEPVLSGRLDIHYLSAGKCLVIDGKTGSAQHVGRAADDWQLRVAAVLCKYEYDATHVRVAFVKPEAGKEGGVDTADYDTDTLNLWEYSIHYHLWFARQAKAPRRAGDWCRYCRAKGICPEASALALIPAASTSLTKEGVLEAVERLAPDQMAAIWLKRSLVGSVFDGIGEKLSGFTDDALASIGLKRRKGKSLDSISNYAGAKERLTQEGMTPEEIESCISVSLPAIRERIAALKNIGKKDAALWVNTELDPYMNHATVNPSIVGE